MNKKISKKGTQRVTDNFLDMPTVHVFPLVKTFSQFEHRSIGNPFDPVTSGPERNGLTKICFAP